MHPSSLSEPDTYSKSSRSIRKSCAQSVARFPTVVGCAGWKCVNASVGRPLYASANLASSAITLTSFLCMMESASRIRMMSVLSPT